MISYREATNDKKIKRRKEQRLVLKLVNAKRMRKRLVKNTMTLQIDLGNYILNIKNFIDDYNHSILIVLQKRKEMSRNYFACKNNWRNGRQFYGKRRAKLVVLLVRRKGLVGWSGSEGRIDNKEKKIILVACLDLCCLFSLHITLLLFIF